MYRLVEARWIGPQIKLFVIEAPRVARKQQAGQFVILRIHEHGERIPLTIAAADPEHGTITLIAQGIGKTTRLLNTLEAGDAILDLVGPLGRASEVRKFGRAVVVGGGVGTAIAYPTARALREAGNEVRALIGARTAEHVILEREMRAVVDRLEITTEDGSLGRKGLVTDVLQEWIASEAPPDYVLAIGPVPMMQAVAEATRPHRIETVVSLNAVMVDGTGMCGGCRVLIGDQPKFACVDGPEFDAHQVNFSVLRHRNAMYREAEAEALRRFEADPQPDLALLPRACPEDACKLLSRADAAAAPSEN